MGKKYGSKDKKEGCIRISRMVVLHLLGASSPVWSFCIFDVGSGHSSLPDVPHDGHAVVDVLTAVVVAAAYPLSEYVGNLADNVTTTRWSDGRTTQDITDKQHHVKVDNIYQYDVYKVKYLVHDIYDHYVCHHCKHDERSYNPKYEELSREYLRSYTGY